MPSAKVKRAIAAFEKAVRDKVYDTVGRNSASTVVEHNYIKARAKLERLMENL